MEVQDAVARWPDFAKDSGIAADVIQRIGATHRLDVQ
jgi:hypothetical protein